jgi:hypothetical protein
MRNRENASLTHRVRLLLDSDTLCLDNGSSSGSGYLPFGMAFTLQLRGPFCATVRAGSHLEDQRSKDLLIFILLSVPPVRRILVLFKVIRLLV